LALSVEFSTTQTIGAPSVIVLTDDSTGTDAAVTQRRIYLVDAQGNYVVPDGTSTDYVNFPIVALSGDEIEIDCLENDMALTITVQWLNVSGTVLYSKTELCGFTLYNETFYYSLTQAQATQSVPPNIVQDTGCYGNKMILRTLIDSGNQAITYGVDITTAQNMYDQATLMTNNENLYF